MYPYITFNEKRKCAHMFIKEAQEGYASIPSTWKLRQEEDEIKTRMSYLTGFCCGVGGKKEEEVEDRDGGRREEREGNGGGEETERESSVVKSSPRRT